MHIILHTQTHTHTHTHTHTVKRLHPPVTQVIIQEIELPDRMLESLVLLQTHPHSWNRPWQFFFSFLCVRSLNKQQTCFETTVAHNVFSSTQDFPYLGMQVVHTPLLFQIGHIALKFSGDGHYQLLADVVAFTRKFAYNLSCPIACSS